MMTQREREAVDRVRTAGVKAPVEAILCWVRSVGPGAIMRATLAEIRGVAAAF
jgi:hypothetical protein